MFLEYQEGQVEEAVHHTCQEGEVMVLVVGIQEIAEKVNFIEGTMIANSVEGTQIGGHLQLEIDRGRHR